MLMFNFEMTDVVRLECESSKMTQPTLPMLVVANVKTVNVGFFLHIHTEPCANCRGLFLEICATKNNNTNTTLQLQQRSDHLYFGLINVCYRHFVIHLSKSQCKVLNIVKIGWCHWILFIFNRHTCHLRSFSQQLSLNISLEGENYDGLWEKQ